MKSPTLSIIIPCYNCASTLQEAIDSCYTQNLEDFEIVMVDDASTDSTREIIKKNTAIHSNIRVIFHDINRGGGAARNMGIKNSQGELLYCLDSDNIFAPNSLKDMILFLKKNSCDGVVFHERRFFKNNIKKFTPRINTIIDRPLELEDLFNESHTLLDNFIFTKESYLRTKGYPENHGFDTQCFEVRYLAAGNKARVCPNTIFYHRQFFGKTSYFEQEYNKGNFSKNYYFILEEILPILTDEAINSILHSDIFGATTLKENNMSAIIDLGTQKKLFISNYKNKLPIENITQSTIEALDNSPQNLFRKGVWLYLHNQPTKSLDQYQKLLYERVETTIVYYNVLRNYILLSRAYSPNQIENRATTLLQTMVPQKKVPSIRQHVIIQKVAGTKFGKILKKIISTS